jgi:hypothetical protein
MNAFRYWVSRALCSSLGRRLLFVAGVLAMLPVVPVYADVGPKPQMRFTFNFEIDPVSITSGQLIECEDETCTSGEPLEERGPQRFTCTESECSSLAYGYAPYHKLVIEFADQTRESNVFTKKAFTAHYQVTVSETGLAVKEVRRLGSGLCCPGFLLTLVLETVVASGYLQLFHLSRTALPWVPLSSLLTLPVVWFVFPQLAWAPGTITGLSEGFAVLFEAGLIYVASLRSVPLRHVAALSLVMNGASFLVGLLL